MLKKISLSLILMAFSLSAADIKLDKALLAKTEEAITKGVKYLLTQQNEDGSFGKPTSSPASTSMVVASIHNTPGIDKKVLEQSINKALDYVLTFAQKDGSIYPAKRDQASSKNYPNYGTATALIALATVNRPQDLKFIKAAREFLKKSQFTDKSKVDTNEE